MLKDGAYVRMIHPYGSPNVTGAIQWKTNDSGKPQMLLIVDPRLKWEPDRFFIYDGAVEECQPPSDSEVERINAILSAESRRRKPTDKP